MSISSSTIGFISSKVYPVVCMCAIRFLTACSLSVKDKPCSGVTDNNLLKYGFAPALSVALKPNN